MRCNGSYADFQGATRACTAFEGCNEDGCPVSKGRPKPTTIDALRPATMERPAYEAVNHPSHYGGDTTYEAIKVIEAWKLDFCLGNTVKYISRAGKKDPTKELEDLTKARWYLDRRIEQLKNQK